MAKPLTEYVKGVFYCAMCGSLGPDEHGHPIGTTFECPNDKTHFAAVVKPPAGMFWLRAEQLIWTLQLFSPLQFFRSGDRAGLYHLFRFVILILAVFFAAPQTSWLVGTVTVSLGVYFLYDILLLSTHATFVSRYPTHPLRSLTLNLSSFFQAAIVFAIVYKLASGTFSRSLGTIDAIYFSVVTIATVGYGDIQVIGTSPNAAAIEVLVVTEIVVGLYMLAGLVAVVASWANQMPGAQAAKSLAELRGIQRPPV